MAVNWGIFAVEEVCPVRLVMTVVVFVTPLEVVTMTTGPTMVVGCTTTGGTEKTLLPTDVFVVELTVC